MVMTFESSLLCVGGVSMYPRACGSGASESICLSAMVVSRMQCEETKCVILIEASLVQGKSQSSLQRVFRCPGSARPPT